MTKLNPSVKHHLLLGGLISLWIFLFAFFIRPFAHGNMNLQLWILVSVGFSLIAFLSYALTTGVQKFIYDRVLKWNAALETSILSLFYFTYSISTYIYYKSYFIKGNYDLLEFLEKIILNSALIFIPILILARRYSIKLIPKKEDFVIITGENKLDILKLKINDLISISNSQNYVEISFIDNGQLKTKLLRTSLKKIQYDFDFLIRVHRSHLINPSHFKSWKNQKTISLTQMELPVSKNYKEQLLSL